MNPVLSWLWNNKFGNFIISKFIQDLSNPTLSVLLSLHHCKRCRAAITYHDEQGLDLDGGGGGKISFHMYIQEN